MFDLQIFFLFHTEIILARVMIMDQEYIRLFLHCDKSFTRYKKNQSIIQYYYTVYVGMGKAPNGATRSRLWSRASAPF